MKTYVFPGQGAQFVGMGKEIYDGSDLAKSYFSKANEILGFDIAKVMFEGSAEDLKQTKVTQPAVFLDSVIKFLVEKELEPKFVAGHSLGEFSALVANGVLSFEDGLKLVSKRALAMQKACDNNPGTMAAILGLTDDKVEEICSTLDGVEPANYNCPGQLVISGTKEGIEKACVVFKEAGAKRALPLPVGGAFHSSLMASAREEFVTAIEEVNFNEPKCPIYQNVTAKPSVDVEEIKQNLKLQLTAPVRWTQSVQAMISDGANEFVESGPGKVLQGLIKKINRSTEVSSL